ncbi:hypothetical protein BGZ94_000641 [Podila epigama]|nr:hypothetical protein BGZ94_000641 [Podila epigama]
MAYYNNNASSPPRAGFTSPPLAPRPVNYISSPFDDDPAPAPASYSNNNSSNNNYEKDMYSASPYNPDYMTASQRSNSFNQTPQHSTHEHSLSPGPSEKQLPLANGETYAMQHLSPAHDGAQQRNLYSNSYDANYGQGNTNNHNNNNNTNYNNSSYYNGYDEERPSLSNDTAPMRPLHEVETSDGIARSKTGISRVKYNPREKSKCLPCFPCIRSTCGRVTCCICLLLLLIIIALAIVIVTVFKLPTVSYKGMEGTPDWRLNDGDTTFDVKLSANIEVINPNPLGFHFESIVATAYYPGYAPSIGGGRVDNQSFPSKSTRTITFPIEASYSRAKDPGFTVVQDVLSRCGHTGTGVSSGLQINYDLKLTIKIIGISISPTIKNQNFKFDCPPDITSIGDGISIPGLN